MKDSYREQIHERAAQARGEREDEDPAIPTEKLPLLLRQIENTINDLRWAESNSFDRHIKTLSRQLHDTEVENVTQQLTEGVDLAAWLKPAKRPKA